MFQQEDMVLFAKLILVLCCNNPSAVNNVHKSLDIVNRHFSLDIQKVIHYLMKQPGPLKVSHGIEASAGIEGFRRIYKGCSTRSEDDSLPSLTQHMCKIV